MPGWYKNLFWIRTAFPFLWFLRESVFDSNLSWLIYKFKLKMAILARIVARPSYLLVRLYWFVFRPKTHGARCVINCGRDVLLIRNTYGQHRWTFPGGGVEKGEEAEEAAKREVREEVGIKLETVLKIGELDSNKEYKHDHVDVFTATVKNKNFRIDPVEILEAAWFPLDNLPELSENAEVFLGYFLNQ